MSEISNENIQRAFDHDDVCEMRLKGAKRDEAGPATFNEIRGSGRSTLSGPGFHYSRRGGRFETENDPRPARRAFFRVPLPLHGNAGQRG